MIQAEFSGFQVPAQGQELALKSIHMCMMAQNGVSGLETIP